MPRSAPGKAAAVTVGPLNLQPHYAALLKVMLADTPKADKEVSQFDAVEGILRDFWQGVSAADRKALGDASAVAAQAEADTAFYEDLIQKLMPDIFAKIDGARTKKIRAFAKQVDSWMVAALAGFPEPFVEMKQRLALEFGQRLRRYTGLNHLVQAANAVLENPAHVRQMVEDYQKVDIAAATDQLHAICPGVPHEAIEEHERTFKAFHEASSGTIETWANWLQGVVEKCMGPYESDEQYSRAGSELLLRWSFMSSLVVRDLTLRSAASFGPFHLMRLLCDEYVYYLIEAAQRGRTPRPHTIELPEGAAAGASGSADAGSTRPKREVDCSPKPDAKRLRAEE